MRTLLTNCCLSNSVRRPFERRHEKDSEEEADSVELIKKASARYEKQSSGFTTL